MSFSITKKLGLTSRADLIDLLSSGDAVFADETAWALGFEFHQELSGTDAAKTDVTSPKEKRDIQQEPGWTQFQPAPTQYWRVTGYESLQQETGKQKRSGRKKKAPKLPDLEEIRKQFGFSIENILRRQPLAEMNYVTTQLRKAAGTGRSRNELDLNAAVDRLSRGQFLYRMPHRVRRVWGHDLLCLEDRAHRLVPYWSDQDDVTTALSRLYPETGYTVARLGHGRTVLRIQSPESLYGHECPLPTPGTLVLALTDLGTLAIGDDGPQVREYWAELGRLYMENGNRAVAMVPCLPEQVAAEVARYWHVIPWERSASAHVVGDDRLGLERLLTLLSVAVRLEPELLRAVRKLLPETRDNPGLESTVWQDAFVASPNSVAADLSPAERKKRIAAFEREPLEVKEEVLNLIRKVRQIGYEDVWVSELLGLDAASQAKFSTDVKLAEQQILSLASPGSKVPLEDYAVWLQRLKEQLTQVPDMKPEVREALAELVKRTADSNSFTMSVWMSGRIGLNPDLPERTFDVCQRGNSLLFEQAPRSVASAGAMLPTGSWVAQLRTRNGEIRIHELHREHEFTEARFWTGGRKPTWVHRFGTDEYGAWCSFRVKDVEQKLRWIPPGDFMMGSPEGEEGRYADEGPQHHVTISRGFWMFETPCTQELWSAVMATDPSEFKGELLPVESVSWDDALKFNDALNRLLPGLELQLPTEAQWEYGCRGPGTEQDKQRARYGELDEIAWWSRNSAGTTHDVGQKQRNGYGLYDMLGNVWEWCRDHAYRTYDQSQHIDPLYESGDTRSARVVRGGSWHSSARFVRAAYRGAYHPEARSVSLGFRCLSSPEPGAEPSREAAMSGSKSQRGGSPQDGVRESPPRGRLLKKGSDPLETSLNHREIERSERVRPLFRQGVSPPSLAVWQRDSATPSSSRVVQVRSDSVTSAASFPRSRGMQIETDCEILSLELAPPPPWAVASGRDRYGLWAEFEINGVRQRLRWIPPGQFLMGSASKPEISWIEEQPQHAVTLTHGFWMFDTPCTQQLWNVSGMKAEFNFPGDQRPVESVSFEQVAAFVDEINTKVAELHLRLPTEAEWEYSCRSGHAGDRYGKLDDIAWYGDNSDGHTQDVKQKQPNAWGLYDMLGNVWEWCLDGSREYTKESAVNPFSEARSLRVVRGGGWGSSAGPVRAASRDASHPVARLDYLGFRCLSSPEPSPEPVREAAMSGSKSLRGGSPQDGERELPPRGEIFSGVSDASKRTRRQKSQRKPKKK